MTVNGASALSTTFNGNKAIFNASTGTIVQKFEFTMVTIDSINGTYIYDYTGMGSDTNMVTGSRVK